jgi:uncharacterized DUF497 family protein
MDYLSKCRGFQWDEGNADKNWIKHKVSRTEAEQVFFNRPLLVSEGEKCSEQLTLVGNFLSFLPSVKI